MRHSELTSSMLASTQSASYSYAPADSPVSSTESVPLPQSSSALQAISGGTTTAAPSAERNVLFSKAPGTSRAISV